MNKLIVIDGNSIAFRAFYALPLLSNANGLHTNAVFGFTTMLLRLIDEEQPTHMMVAFDAGKATFRHEQFEAYKGGRAKTPPELSEQFPLIRELVDSMAISRYELDGYEADDIIGTLTRLADERQDTQVLVVSGDKDMLQLASPYVTVLLTRKGISEVDRFDPQHIQDVYGIAPLQIIDMKGLMGDSSDNIPGIPGVGEKTALKLLHEYGSVEGVLEHASELKGKLKEKVEEHRDDALKSKQLATIFREVPLEHGWDKLVYNGYDREAAAELFRRLEFRSLLDRLELPSGGAADDTQQRKLNVRLLSADDIGELLELPDGPITMHVEIAGDNPHTAQVLGAGFCAADGLLYAPLDALLSEQAAPVRALLADAGRPKRLYDGHKAEAALRWAGVALAGIEFDVLLAAYLLDPTESSHSLARLARKESLPDVPEDEDVFGKGAKFHIPGAEAVAELVCRKADAVCALEPILRERLKRYEMLELLVKLEQPLATVLTGMELRGIRVNTDALREYGEELAVKISGLEQRIYEHAGCEFNINSTKQLGEILFEKLGLPVWKKTKTGYSTDAEVLEKLEPYNEIIGLILHYRQLAKLQSTYIEGLLKEVKPDTGKIHTYYRQAIAATGRLSSQYPNLQNIPIRLEEGRKIRKVFTPEQDGWRIVAADYSQIELRVLAHISGDKRLIEAFINDMDIHTKTAMDVFGVDESAVDAGMRRQAKAVNFGIVYGISDYGLSQNLSITRKEAAQFIEQYFEVFQGVRKFMTDVVEQARQDGYVTTLLQRRRYLPEINASNFNLRSFAERTAMNTPIQGTAADIIKLAMVRLAQRMQEEGVRSRLLLQVHDELVLESPQDEVERIGALVREVMEGALKLDVPLKVDVSDGADWYEAK